MQASAHPIRWSPDGVADALASGCIVVVWAATGSTREHARLAGRQLCAALLAAGRGAACQVSRSAANGVAVVGLSGRHTIGIDVETERVGVASEGVDMLHPSERGAWEASSEAPTLFRHLWCRKEAVLKAFGVGLSTAPNWCPVGPPSSAWQPLVIERLGRAQVRSIDIAFDAALSVAVIGADAPRLAVFGA